MYRLVPVSIGLIGILAVCKYAKEAISVNSRNIGQLSLLQFMQGLTTCVGLISMCTALTGVQEYEF